MASQGPQTGPGRRRGRAWGRWLLRGLRRAGRGRSGAGWGEGQVAHAQRVAEVGAEGLLGGLEGGRQAEQAGDGVDGAANGFDEPEDGAGDGVDDAKATSFILVQMSVQEPVKRPPMTMTTSARPEKTETTAPITTLATATAAAMAVTSKHPDEGGPVHRPLPAGGRASQLRLRGQGADFSRWRRSVRKRLQSGIDLHFLGRDSQLPRRP
jgi:hypothetical protein